MLNKKNQKIRRVLGTSARPRVSVFRSNKAILAQVIDDEQGKTIFSLSSEKIANGNKPVEKAVELGKALAKLVKEKKIVGLVFDRRKYQYHGRVKALAEGIREEGIII